MTADMRWTDRLAIEISECKHMGLKVLGPDINESYGDFGIVGGKNTIRFGLSGIKNMGKSLVEEYVIPERDKNGPFKSVCDFASRVNATKFNKNLGKPLLRLVHLIDLGTGRICYLILRIFRLTEQNAKKMRLLVRLIFWCDGCGW